jgi:hypothetical protein
MLPEAAAPPELQRSSSSSRAPAGGAFSKVLDGVTNSIGSGASPFPFRRTLFTPWLAPGVGAIASTISSKLDMEEYEYLDVWGHRRQSAELSKDTRKQLARASNSKQSDAEMREMALSAGDDDHASAAQQDESSQSPDFLFEPAGFAAFGPLQFTKRFAGGVRADIVRYLPYSGGTWTEFFDKKNRASCIVSVGYLFCAYVPV